MDLLYSLLTFIGELSCQEKKNQSNRVSKEGIERQGSNVANQDVNKKSDALRKATEIGGQRNPQDLEEARRKGNEQSQSGGRFT